MTVELEVPATSAVFAVVGGRAATRQQAELFAAQLVDERFLASDVVWAQPESERWTVEEVVELVVRPSHMRPYGDRRVIVVADADRMAKGASDRLLLTIEEPSASVTFMLLCADAANLPATIRGRMTSVVELEVSRAAAPWLAATGDVVAAQATDMFAMFPGWVAAADNDTELQQAVLGLQQWPTQPFRWAAQTVEALEKLAVFDPFDGSKSGDKKLRAARVRSGAAAVLTSLRSRTLDNVDVIHAPAVLERFDAALTATSRNLNVKHCLAYAASR